MIELLESQNLKHDKIFIFNINDTIIKVRVSDSFIYFYKAIINVENDELKPVLKYHFSGQSDFSVFKNDMLNLLNLIGDDFAKLFNIVLNA